MNLAPHTDAFQRNHLTVPHQPESNVTYSQRVSLPCPVLIVIVKLCQLNSNAVPFFFLKPVCSYLFECTTDGGQTLTVAQPSVPPLMFDPRSNPYRGFIKFKSVVTQQDS